MTQLIATDKAGGRQRLAAAWPMYRALVGLGGLCGLLLALVYVVTRPAIEKKQAEHLQNAVFAVLPGTQAKRNFAMLPSGRFEITERITGDDLVFAGYDAEGHLAGLAVPAQGMGYQDSIRLLYGYQPTSKTIVGMQILASKETPGLGDKIEYAPHFVNNFRHLDVALNTAGTHLQNSIVAVKQGHKTAPWQLDGITGATISSNAIASILDRSAQVWIARLEGHLADFQSVPVEVRSDQ